MNMLFPQIRLQSTSAKIEITIQKDNMFIEQPHADVNIQQPNAEMQIDRVPSKLTIDQTKARAEVGIKSAAQTIADAAQQGQQDVLQGIARRVHEGDELMKIENHGNAIADIAKNTPPIPQHEFELGFVPSIGSVKIDYDPGSLTINWKINKPIIDIKANKPIINYTPGSVSVGMQTYQSLKMSVAHLNVPGTNVELSV